MRSGVGTFVGGTLRCSPGPPFTGVFETLTESCYTPLPLRSVSRVSHQVFMFLGVAERGQGYRPYGSLSPYWSRPSGPGPSSTRSPKNPEDRSDGPSGQDRVRTLTHRTDTNPGPRGAGWTLDGRERPYQDRHDDVVPAEGVEKVSLDKMPVFLFMARGAPFGRGRSPLWVWGRFPRSQALGPASPQLPGVRSTHRNETHSGHAPGTNIDLGPWKTSILP